MVTSYDTISSSALSISIVSSSSLSTTHTRGAYISHLSSFSPNRTFYEMTTYKGKSSSPYLSSFSTFSSSSTTSTSAGLHQQHHSNSYNLPPASLNYNSVPPSSFINANINNLSNASSSSMYASSFSGNSNIQHHHNNNNAFMHHSPPSLISPSSSNYFNTGASTAYMSSSSSNKLGGGGGCGAAEICQTNNNNCCLPPSSCISTSPSCGIYYNTSKEKRRLTEVEIIINKYNLLKSTQRALLILSVIITIIFLAFILYVSCYDFAYFVILMSLLLSITAVIFSFWILAWILRFDEGTSEMRDVSDPIREGSEGFFKVQYGTILKISVCFAFIILLLYTFRGIDTSSSPVIVDNNIINNNNGINRGDIQYVTSLGLAVLTAVCFLMGALCSALTGYAGMWVSVRTNIRVASAARRCYNEALQLCFRGGAFSSIVNVSLAVYGISSIILFLRLFFPSIPFNHIPLLIVGYGFGASLVAMFAQLGGGIYTKGADVGADLVGKVEAGIPEDDPRNPAVIADLVGDNVGDCAGQCADLFESIAAEIISAMILGGALAYDAKLDPDVSSGYVLFPLGVHCMDLFISSIGILLVRTKKGMPDADSAAGAQEDPLKIMIKAYLVTCLLGIIGFMGLCRYFLYTESHPSAWKNFAICGAIGMICAFLFVIITQYYTDYEYPKVKRIAEASVTGPATNVIAGLSVGMESTCLPVLCICVSLISSYYLGLWTGLSVEGKTTSGLFGTAVSTMGMLCTAVYVLSMSSFGPIADNAGGIVEMSLQSVYVRAVTDRLDAVGNVTKANTKGFSVGSASLACFLLFSAFLDEVTVYAKMPFEVIDLAKPEVFVGGLMGSMLVFLFSSWAMEAVGRAAQEVVKEVRRQFAENPGIMDFHEKPDYHTCVAIVSRAALREMIKPGLLAILSPVIIGVIFRALGNYQNKPLLGAEVIASFLMFCTATGILMALFLNNGGGAWDNAKKYIETGALGGKNSDAHKAAVVGDTVGDPCKDTAGPSVHVLIKLVSTVTMVLTPIFVSPQTRVFN